MKDTDSESFLIRLLCGLGFSVERIQRRAAARTADFLASDVASSYVIEVKGKTDADELFIEYRERLDKHDVFVHQQDIARTDAIANVLDEAQKQLESTDIDADAFCLVWLQLEALDRKVQWEQAIRTIYGAVDLILVGPGKHKCVPCYYFDHNIAFKHQDIDAFIVTDGEDISLCLNGFSQRADSFRASKLFEAFGRCGGAIDPRALEDSGQIVVADCSEPRKNQAAVVEFLENKYNSRFIVSRRTSTTASVAVPAPIEVKG